MRHKYPRVNQYLKRIIQGGFADGEPFVLKAFAQRVYVEMGRKVANMLEYFTPFFRQLSLFTGQISGKLIP
jgi:hypothetical protein